MKSSQLAGVKYWRLFLSVKRDAPRIRPRIDAKGSEENTANVGGIFTRRLGKFSHLRFMKNAHLRSVKHSSLNSATFSLSNKSGDRIILTREKIDLSLRGTKSSDELVDLAMFPTMSNFYRIFIRDNINRMYVRNRNIFIKIFFTLLFLNLFASDKIREKPLRQRFFSFLG